MFANGIVSASQALYVHVLTPFGRLLVSILTGLKNGTVVVLHFVHGTVLVPVGQGLRAAAAGVQYGVMATGRAATSVAKFTAGAAKATGNACMDGARAVAGLIRSA